jgi:hypothetical protein
MMQDPTDRQKIVLEVSRAELTLINNALNEVSNGIHMDEDEFQTRLGGSVEDARGLLRHIQALLSQ